MGHKKAGGRRFGRCKAQASRRRQGDVCELSDHQFQGPRAQPLFQDPKDIVAALCRNHHDARRIDPKTGKSRPVKTPELAFIGFKSADQDIGLHRKGRRPSAGIQTPGGQRQHETERSRTRRSLRNGH